MSKRLGWFLIIVVGLGFLALKMMPQLNTPAVSSLVVAGIGVLIFVMGIQTFRSRKVGFESKRANFGRTEVYRGLAAQLYGILFILFALLIFALEGVIWLYPGGITAFLTVFFSQPWSWGIILVILGGVAGVEGVIRLMAGSAGYYQGLQDKVLRVSGVFPLIFGGILAIAGLLLIFAHAWVADLINQFINSIFR